jgi:hypothetical protein
LVVNGAAVLRGELNVSIVNGFLPEPGDTFEILSYPSFTGFFDQISGLNVGENLYLQPAFHPTNLVLTVLDTRPHPLLGQPMHLPNGDIWFPVGNVAGQDFIIETSPNLEMPVWTPILTNWNSGALFEFIEADRETSPRRFFRAILLPPHAEDP